MIRIERSALLAIYDQAQREYPRECCGIVFGPSGGASASRVHACENVQDALHAGDPVRHPCDARRAFAFGTADLLRLAKSLRGAEPAKVVYHSHPDVGAHFSRQDAAWALMGGAPCYPVEHLVVDVRGDGVREARQYAWSAAERAFVQVERYDALGHASADPAAPLSP